MTNFICTTCGTQYAESEQPPAGCAICQDERQYIKATGQQWTTRDKLRLTHRQEVLRLERRLAAAKAKSMRHPAAFR
jgi:predicted metal-binding protein